jgi:DNA-binding Lrp family transcriptional regulator
MDKLINNEEITKRVLILMNEKNVSGYKLCKDLNIPNGSFVNIKKGRQGWNLEYLVNISQYFKVDLCYLIYGDEEKKNEVIYKRYEDENILLKEEIKKYKERINEITKIAVGGGK